MRNMVSIKKTCDDSGQTLVETGLIYLLISIAVLFALNTFGQSLYIYFLYILEQIPKIAD